MKQERICELLEKVKKGANIFDLLTEEDFMRPARSSELTTSEVIEIALRISKDKEN